MKDLTVRVTRYYEHDGMPTYLGAFVSKVYAIEGNEFLVHDPGDEFSYGGFEWVDFTVQMISLKPGEQEWEPMVKLVEDEWS